MEISRKKPHDHRRHDSSATESKSFSPHLHHRHPSFSSSLLDAIDQSMVKSGSGGGVAAALPLLRCSTRLPADEKKRADHRSHSRHAPCSVREERRFSSRVSEKPAYEKRPLQHSRMREIDRFSCVISTSSSSESSYGGFSSSETESAVRTSRPLPKPVRAADTPEQNTKSSIRSKLRASKVSQETKTERIPVSPGARLAGFINSLFSSAAHPKKAKVASMATSSAAGSVIRGGDESGCSSASSFSRACLSKPAANRSVRFMDEGSRSLPRLTAIRVREEPQPPPPLPPPLRPCSDLAAALAEERMRYEKARKLISAYEERKRSGSSGIIIGEEEDEDEDDDDAASYCSSDLFELKDLSATGNGDDELPVYDTTNFSSHAASRGITV